MKWEFFYKNVLNKKYCNFQKNVYSLLVYWVFPVSLVLGCECSQRCSCLGFTEKEYLMSSDTAGITEWVIDFTYTEGIVE